MGIDAEDFRNYVIRPALHRIGVYRTEVELLLLGTAAVESQLGAVLKGAAHQASGIYHLHGVAHRHIWDDYLATRPELASKVRGLASQRDFLNHPHAELMTNMSYASAVCWLAYCRHSDFYLSHKPKIAELASCWKHYYHPKNDLTVSDFIQQYNKLYIAGDAAA